MNYFKNENDVCRIGNLQLENRLDRVTIFGDIDITCDQAGRHLVLELLKHLQAIDKAMSDLVRKGSLPEKIATNPTPAPENIFGQTALSKT